MPKVADNSVDCIITDHPFKLGTDTWVGMGTTRPHAKMGERTYPSGTSMKQWLRDAFRILRKDKEWNTINKERKLAGDWPSRRGRVRPLCTQPNEDDLPTSGSSSTWPSRWGSSSTGPSPGTR